MGGKEACRYEGTPVHWSQTTLDYRYGDDRGTHVIDKHPSLEGDPCQLGGVLSPSGRGVEHLRQRAGKRFHLVTLPSTSDKRLPSAMQDGHPYALSTNPLLPSGPNRIQDVRMDGLDHQGTHPHTHTHTHAMEPVNINEKKHSLPRRDIGRSSKDKRVK